MLTTGTNDSVWKLVLRVSGAMTTEGPTSLSV